MRRKTRRSLWLAAVLVSLLTLGAGSADDKKEVDDGLDMYFRDADLLALTDQPMPIYPNTVAGESEKLLRDFPDAPPQIPHTVEGMYPITVDDNECLECHHPDNIVSKKDLPVPDSHFRAAVMGKGDPGDPMVWVVKDYKKIDDLVGARYVCSMCHTPQASNVNTPNNRFVSARKAQKSKKKKQK
ncbi:MAG: nitrate reductase cytochrome c-type subunit [Deltaproteobacteria bacterium]|nr:nitrate reductase cytochrome c-type subunit [Deltaproteobacteria bacterium]